LTIIQCIMMSGATVIARTEFNNVHTYWKFIC
jgi:hypothetical protein